MASEIEERIAKALRAELEKIGYGVGTVNAAQLSDALARAAIEALTTNDLLKELDRRLGSTPVEE